jgi:hypothetical protein
MTVGESKCDMTGLSPSQLRGLFWVTELNLLFWLSASFDATRFPDHFPINPITIPGLVLAIGLQHWAYQNLFKRA